MSDDPVKRAWQASVEIGGVPPIDQARAGADKFYRVIRRRNLAEYTAGAVVVVAYGIYVFALPHLLHKIGSGMILLAAFFVLWQLHRRASAVPPERAGTMPLAQFMRIQLVRQRDALKSVLGWYIAPFVPGFVLFVMGNAGAAAGEMGAIVPLRLGDWLFLAFFIALLASIWWFNQRIARKLQRAIDEIDALTGGEE
jgi:hypothetical protein